MILSEDEKKDKNIFKQIIKENWGKFKKKYSSYNKPQTGIGKWFVSIYPSKCKKIVNMELLI